MLFRSMGEFGCFCVHGWRSFGTYLKIIVTQLNSRIKSSSIKIFCFATILYLNFFILPIGVRDEIKRNIFPFLFICCFA